jgi:hypothetical protein
MIRNQTLYAVQNLPAKRWPPRRVVPTAGAALSKKRPGNSFVLGEIFHSLNFGFARNDNLLGNYGFGVGAVIKLTNMR